MSAWRELDLTGASEAMRARFWAKVDQRGVNECWLWTAYARGNGYGQFRTDDSGQLQTSSRVALALSIGRAVLANEVACHHCDNPPCCNPKHLFVGTQRDNATDMIRKGRQVPVHGEDHPDARLTEVLVLAIRRDEVSWGSDTRWAKQLGVSANTIHRARIGRTWRHVNVMDLS